VRVKNVNNFPLHLTAVGNRLFFSAIDSVHGIELWVSDGTSAGTHMVRDIASAVLQGSDPQELTAVNGSLYFSAADNDGDRELYVSDGTAAGTRRLRNINPAITGGPDQTSSSPTGMTELFGTIWFSAEVGGDRELWKTNGTASGTVRVKNINPAGNSNPEELTASQGLMFLRATVNGVDQLWRSDGTGPGTKPVTPGSVTDPDELVDFQFGLYFGGTGGGLGHEPWKAEVEQ
jgi:ELWxxDGT repeat protein